MIILKFGIFLYVVCRVLKLLLLIDFNDLFGL